MNKLMDQNLSVGFFRLIMQKKGEYVNCNSTHLYLSVPVFGHSYTVKHLIFAHYPNGTIGSDVIHLCILV